MTGNVLVTGNVECSAQSAVAYTQFDNFWRCECVCAWEGSVFIYF